MNKKVLNEIEKVTFNNDIMNDPLRLSYYSALREYKDCLQKKGEPAKRKVLIKIMETNDQVLHLLINVLNITEGLYYDQETYKLSRGSFTYPIYQKWGFRGEPKFERLTYGIGGMNNIVFYSVRQLFPSAVFDKFNTNTTDEILKLLNKRLVRYTPEIKEKYTKEMNDK